MKNIQFARLGFNDTRIYSGFRKRFDADQFALMFGGVVLAKGLTKFEVAL